MKVVKVLLHVFVCLVFSTSCTKKYTNNRTKIVGVVMRLIGTNDESEDERIIYEIGINDSIFKYYGLQIEYDLKCYSDSSAISSIMYEADGVDGSEQIMNKIKLYCNQNELMLDGEKRNYNNKKERIAFPKMQEGNEIYYNQPRVFYNMEEYIQFFNENPNASLAQSNNKSEPVVFWFDSIKPVCIKDYQIEFYLSDTIIKGVSLLAPHAAAR